MYYDDMSIYEYMSGFPMLTVFNIGWLEGEHPYTTGDIDDEALNQIRQILFHEKDINKMRGFHMCSLCPYDPVHHAPMYVQIDGKARTLGMSEIWIPGDNDVVYAAPSMIYHYIVEHTYKPPEMFLEALRKFDVNSPWDALEARDRLFMKYLPRDD